MAQITWRNINNPSFTGGNQAIESGNELLLGGLSKFAGIGSGLERDQKAEQTAAALDQINQLDRSGLATALAGNEFQGLGNVDQSAINKALRGRDKDIDAEIDAKYARDELLTKRGEQPTLSAIELAMANKEYEKAATLSEALSDKSRAKVTSGITQAQRADTRIADEDKVRTDRIQNETDADYISNTILGSEAQILDIQAQGGNADAYIQDVIQNAVNAEGKDLDTSEISKLRQGLLAASNPEFTEATKFAIAGQVADETEDIQFEHDELATNYTKISNIAAGGQESEEERLAGITDLMKEIESRADGSFIPSSWTGKNGLALKESMNSLLSEGHSPKALKAAMLMHSEGVEEAGGNPDTFMGKVRTTMQEWASEKDGGRLAQLAVEFVPVPTTNSKRDLFAYKQALAKMKKSLRGPKGEERLARLLKQEEQKVKSSERSLNKRKRAVNSKARAQMAQSLRASN